MKFSISKRLFSGPKPYKFWIELKRRIYQDKKIGVDEYILGKSVLNIGCGPNYNREILEYDPDSAANHTGLDNSQEFLENIRTENPGAKHRFVLGSATGLPFNDMSFDTAVLSFVMHHIDEDPKSVIREAKMVARESVIIFDHLRSENRMIAFVQQAYWDIFDGGTRYLTESEWRSALEGTKIRKRIVTGAIFGHVVKFVLNVSR